MSLAVERESPLPSSGSRPCRRREAPRAAPRAAGRWETTGRSHHRPVSHKTPCGLCETPACANGRARASVSLAWPPYPHNRQNGREFSYVAYQARGGLPGTGIAGTPHRYVFHDHGSEVANSAANCP